MAPAFWRSASLAAAASASCCAAGSLPNLSSAAFWKSACRSACSCSTLILSMAARASESSLMTAFSPSQRLFSRANSSLRAGQLLLGLGQAVPAGRDRSP